ncbi:MAG TPA: alpha/beta fold hydrolase [Burkholderiales bacterium]|nr:alpha/beta fold hydrolase [Burkholderiales bacterium]
MAVYGIDHIQLAMPAGGEALARRFCVELLGLEEIPKPPALAARGGAWFRCGAMQLHLGVEADFRAAKKAHPGLLVRDLAGLLSRLREAGFEVKFDQAPLAGFERAFTADPFGNRIELLEATPWPLPEGVKSVEIDGYPLAYVEAGSGPPVVLVHGSLNDFRTWRPQMSALSMHFRVIAPSLRHYYPEPWKGEGEFSLQRHAKDVTAFIEKLGVGPVRLVGWSRGGYVAADVAIARPDLVTKLVLMDPGLNALIATMPGAPKADVRAERAAAARAYFDRADMEGGLRFFFNDISGAGAWDRLPEEQRQLRRDNAWTIVGKPGDTESITREQFSTLSMPVLLMQGEESPPAFKRIHAAALECIPAARRVDIPRAGHQMHQANPDATSRELIAFLSD